MFIFNEDTKQNINLINWFKNERKSLGISKNALEIIEQNNIESFNLTNILNQNNTFCEPSNDVREIYVFEIILKHENADINDYLNTFINYNKLANLFIIKYLDEIKFLIPIKQINKNNEIKILHVYESNEDETNWIIPKDTSKLETIFKSMVTHLTKYNFWNNESFKEYVERINSINTLKKEISALNKKISIEKQTWRINDFYNNRQLKLKELSRLEEEN